MKLLPVFLIVMTAGVLCAGEAGPENTFLTIQNRKISGQTSIVKTELRGDTLDVELQAESTGKGTYDFDIPAGAKKIRLFGCEFDLPPPDHTAFFRAVMMENIPRSILKCRTEEIQYAMVLVSVAPDRKNFDVQIRYKVSSGTEMWIHEHNCSCLVADDGQIFEVLSPEEQRRMGPGVHYSKSGECVNQNGALRIRLRTGGHFYKYFSEKELPLGEIALPKPDPRPCTEFFLNMPFKEKYLEDNRSGENFKVKKSVAEFRDFAEKLKLLRCGMTPGETAAILGKPDRYSTAGAKGPGVKAHAYAEYFFLNTEVAGSPGMMNLSVSLRFEKEQKSDGIFRLKTVY